MTIKVKLLEDGVMPQYGSDGAAGLDLYLPRDVYIHEGKTTVVSLQVCFEVPEGYVGMMHCRSSSLPKQRVHVATGVIDSDYRGPVHLVAYGIHGDVKLTKGMRVAQLLVQPVNRVELLQVDNLSDTARGLGGIGSTGA